LILLGSKNRDFGGVLQFATHLDSRLACGVRYCNIILVKPTLKRYIGVKSIETNLDKRNLSHNIINTIGGKYLKAPKRPNKGRKYNSNTPKNKSNRIKKVALLGRYPSR
jgi:hypothetical protein